MTLGQKQEQFSEMVSRLLVKAQELGYKVRIGHVLRCRDCKVGQVNSLHKEKLAIDINLFKNGVWLKNSEDHKELGEWWESIGGSWGGRFNDGNHYSLSYRGLR